MPVTDCVVTVAFFTMMAVIFRDFFKFLRKDGQEKGS